MPASPIRRQKQATLASRTKQYGPDHPLTQAARLEYEDSAIDEMVAQLPPMSDAQRRRLVRAINATATRQRPEPVMEDTAAAG